MSINMALGKTGKLILYSSGIFLFFFAFGLIQENITRTQYVNSDSSVEYFNYSVSLVFIYCFVNYVLSSLLLAFKKEEDSTPRLQRCLCAAVFCLAMLCANLALQFINYPTQVVAKSCKPVPIMIFSVLSGRKNYSFKKCAFVMMTVTGVILFLYKNKQEADKSEGLGIGGFLVFCSLFMDGILSLFQEVMRSEHQTKPLSMMTSIDKWASVYLGVFWILTKEFYTFGLFLQRHPSVIWKLCGLSMFGFLGQFCVTSTVVEFGTLPASVITTVRKFFSVLTSVLLLGNPLLPRQWVGTILVFSGLLLDALYGKSVSKAK